MVAVLLCHAWGSQPLLHPLQVLRFTPGQALLPASTDRAWGAGGKVSDVWFGGEKCTLHLSSALLVVSRMIFLLKAVGFIKDYYFRHPFLLLLKAH